MVRKNEDMKISTMIQVLEVLTKKDATQTEIYKTTGITQSWVSRRLATFESLGLVKKFPKQGRIKAIYKLTKTGRDVYNIFKECQKFDKEVAKHE